MLSSFWPLSYHATTFTVRKFELLFYKINACLQKTTTCIGLQAEQIFSVNFSILGVAFAVLFLCYFQKLQLLVVKKLNCLWHCISIFLSSKSVSQIFKILFQTGDINIFVLCAVFFSRCVQLKSSFSHEKNISCEIWDTLS